MSLGFGEMLVVLVVGLLVLGPERLPKAARQMGRMFHQLKRLMNDTFHLD